MSEVKIDNKTDDGITVEVNGETHVVPEDERLSVSLGSSRAVTVRVQRTRLLAHASSENKIESPSESMKKQAESPHFQQTAIFEIELISSKCTVKLESDATVCPVKGIDSVFSGYKAELTGGKIKNQRTLFASAGERKRFIGHHLRDAFLPVGLGAIILLLLGISSVASNLVGNTPNIGGINFTMPWSVGLTAVGLGFLIYTIYNIAAVLKTAKKLTE